MSATPSVAIGPERLSINAISVLVTLGRLARPNGLVSLGVPGRSDSMRDIRTDALLAGVDELLAADWIRLAPDTVVRSHGELVLDVAAWLERAS